MQLWQSRTGLKEPVLDLAHPIRQRTQAAFAALLVPQKIRAPALEGRGSQGAGSYTASSWSCF